ncbi:Bacteriophage A118, Gp4, minor capsid [uncultured Caudovirales phage]|uniref:Bacteriophage A118, Gp4, minor capsid n=1 Tax=uncultured Caudovirales phage TaxID=2100421 RepID=A0A6J5S1E0_9CAUD|nr:Bacteriophage A118, Gp4, minor capsid [uncultured Caudovirales phage]
MPAVPPNDPIRVAKGIADLYGEATARLLEQMVKRLAAGVDDPTLSTESWAFAKLSELTSLRRAAQQEVNRLQGSVMADLTKSLSDARAWGAADAAAEFGEVSAAFRPKTNEAAVRALVEETLTGLRQSNVRILRTVNDVYRSIVSEVSAPGVVVGAESRLAATQRALNAFADRGITGFVDSKGRQHEIQSYAEMATRTAAQRSMVAGRLSEYNERDVELVIVSDSPGECEMCEPFEGQLLSLNGRNVGDSIDGFDVVATIEDAESEGLFHPNCRHDVRPFVPGLTKPMGATADPAGNAIRVEQRRLERDKRTTVRREAVALSPDEKAKATARKSTLNARLNLIAENPAEYAKQASQRSTTEQGTAKWAKVAEAAPTSGKRLAYREQTKRAR